MSTIELKSSFHHLIDQIQDERMLRNLYDCIADFALNNDTQFQLSEEQLKRLQDSMSQIEKGKLIENETVKQNVKQWLSK
ncbi:MAG: hypothetical protein LCH91_02165 [Bacteroidetes bacterium]|nr:hypothetical protein [Bacteroidota bacterium]